MKSGMNSLKLAVAIGVVAVTATAMAQGRRGGFGFGGRGGGMFNDPTFLLGMEPVQKELTLSEEQKTKVQQLVDDNRNAMQDIFQLSPEERQTKMQERAKENKKKLGDILLAQQNERLDQISLQFALQTQGPSALLRDEVAEKLGLTAEQKQKLQGLVDDMQQKIQGIFQDAAGDFAGAQEKVTKLRDELKGKAVELLTADQKKKWETMTGKEFKIDLTQVRGGFGFGRRGGQQN